MLPNCAAQHQPERALMLIYRVMFSDADNAIIAVANIVLPSPPNPAPAPKSCASPQPARFSNGFWGVSFTPAGG